MSRLPTLERAQMTPAQQAVNDRIASGPRGRVRGPLAAWLHSPGFAAAAHPIGEYLRWNSPLSGRIAELAILVVARHWDSDFEWYVHAPMAAKAGVPQAVVDAIGRRRSPPFDDVRDEAVYRVVNALLSDKPVDEAAFAHAREVLGIPALVELAGLAGYYSLGAFTLKLFELAPAEGEEPRLPRIDDSGKFGF